MQKSASVALSRCRFAARSSLDHADIPSLGIDAMDFGGGLVSAWLGRVTPAIGSAAEGQELAVG